VRRCGVATSKLQKGKAQREAQTDELVATVPLATGLKGLGRCVEAKRSPGGKQTPGLRALSAAGS
jgi:hypothetical protein